VPYVLPGETVRAQTLHETAGLVRARPLEVLRPSPDRIEPACPHFACCGGCQYQHARYEAQLRWKEAILRETLWRGAKLAAPERLSIISGPPLAYRNRVQLHLSGSRIGFHQAGSHRLCPVRECPVAAPPVQQALAVLRRMIPQPRFPRFIRSIELFTNGEQVQVNVLDGGGRRVARDFFRWCAKRIPGADSPAIDYPAAGELYRVGRRSFFQVNRFLVDRLVEVALDGVAGQTAVDLYAGAGLFSLPLARRVGTVTAVESVLRAWQDLRFNAARAGLRVQAERNTAERFLETMKQTPDLVLADPPRAGLGRRVVEQLLRISAPQLRIISCEPPALARDLAWLTAGGYQLEGLTLVDLFPHTAHIEAVARLTRD